VEEAIFLGDRVFVMTARARRGDERPFVALKKQITTAASSTAVR
jgi:ABC-type nitrate/sulfonate/bicarbonate transport system ATPase subunit